MFMFEAETIEAEEGSMSSDLEKRMKNLDDVSQIIKALYTYGLAIDTHRYELFDQVFAKEIRADYNPPVYYKTLDEIKSHMKAFHEALDGSQHNITNPQVVVNGDQATSISYVVVRLVKAKDYFQMGCYYDDTWLRTPEGWRIKTRLCRGNYWEGNPATGGEVAPGQNLDPLLHSLKRAAGNNELSYLKVASRN
jgi:SnoaL-like domain